MSESDEREKFRTLATGYRDAAWIIWLTATITFSPLLLPILEPSSLPEILGEFWDLYLLCLGVPYAIGTAFWLHWLKLRKQL